MRLLHRFLLATVMLVATALPSPSQSATLETRPSVRKILDTGPDWVSGVAEPASARFIVYADEQAIRIRNRQTGKTVSVPVKVRAVLEGSLSISRSGRRLIFPVDDDAKRTTYLWTMDLDTLTGAPITEPHRISVVPSRMGSISNDGRWIAFLEMFPPSQDTPRPGARLLVMPSDGGNERMLDSAGRMDTPRWSADDKTIYYIRGRGRGPALTRVAFAGGQPDSIAPAAIVSGVSPDGRHIAFHSTPQSGRGDVQIATLDGRVIGSFDSNSPDNALYGFSHSETRGLIAFRRTDPATLKTVSLADGRTSPYAIADPNPVNPQFSPSGSRLAFVSELDGRNQLIVYDTASKQRRVLFTNSRLGWFHWQWSPNGSHIAFISASNATQHHELGVVDVSTSRVTQLADMQSLKPSNAAHFRWRSDSKAIDYIVGTSTLGDSPVELRRVTLAGTQSMIRSLPPSPQGESTDPGYRLVNDTLVIIGKSITAHDLHPENEVIAVPIPSGEPHVLTSHGAYWMVSETRDIASPDGKWIALGSIGSRTARAFRSGRLHPQAVRRFGCSARQWIATRGPSSGCPTAERLSPRALRAATIGAVTHSSFRSMAVRQDVSHYRRTTATRSLLMDGTYSSQRMIRKSVASSLTVFRPLSAPRRTAVSARRLAHRSARPQLHACPSLSPAAF
jgi:Tol biopolymer transport system component